MTTGEHPTDDRPAEAGTLAKARASAKLLTDPASVAAMIISGHLIKDASTDDHAGLMIELDSKVEAVRSGDMAGLEAVLVSQVHSLNAMFSDFAMRGVKCRSEFPQAFERYTRLGLKAQAQCRATVETIAEMKNPPVVFARTANVATGHQQNNYYGADDDRARNYGSSEQPHAATSADRTRERTALPGADPLGNGVPIASDAKRSVSHARRQIDRCAEG